MAFASVAAVNVSYTDVSGTTHTVSLPAGVVNGSRVVAMVSVDATCSFTWPGGWTELYDATAVGFSVSVAYRDCDGSEGASISVTSSASGVGEHCTARIAGHATGTAPVLASATGGPANPNPPNCAPGLGALDFLWLVMIAHDADTTMTAPTNYTESLDANGGAGTGTMWIGYRQLNAASEDPGTASAVDGNDWHAFTIAISPGASFAPPPAFPRPRLPHAILAR